jgi:hypothetical protein
MGALTDVLSDVRDSIDDTEELSSSAKDFKKSAGKFKKSSKSVIKAAKGNIFEFPVFVANSVPLDYATATVALLEQVYASYLQMAISINPIIDDETARKGAQFDHLRSDVNKYLECVDPTDMPYAYDACHAVYEENGITCEFNLVNIEDATAKIINEAMDHEPLSEFDHFFSETYVGDGAGFFDGCEWIQEAKDNKWSKKAGELKKDEPKTNTDYSKSSAGKTTKKHESKSDAVDDIKQFDYLDKKTGQVTTLETIRKAAPTSSSTTDETVLSPIEKDLKAWQIYQTKIDCQLKLKQLEEADEQGELTKQEKVINGKRIEQLKQQIKQADKELTAFDANQQMKQKLDSASLEKLQEEKKKTAKEIEKLEKDLENYDEDRELKNEKTKAETEKSKAEIEKLKRQGKWDEEDRELDKAKKLNDARVKTPQFLDESKIQKLNTMKPLMMSVDLNVVDKNGSLSRPVSYVIGVKCHTRLIDSSILPEVAAYPLKEMNKQLRKIKWRSGELKFGRDLLWKVKSKKQTASDARDKKRKWYRRLYELSHMSGDGVAAASIKNGKSPWANWWQDKLTGGNNKDVGHGLIPNATIIMSKSDVDNIKREKDIDLLSGSKAAKMCKELFLIGMVVIDEDAESVKVLFPDLHNDYDVMSIAAVKKQLAQLDTAGTKTRDIMKLLG